MATVDIYSRYTYNEWNWVPAPISQKSPVKDYELSLEAFLILMNFPQLWIYAAGTKIPINMSNIKDYYPEYDSGSSGGGGGGTTIEGYTKAQVDAKISSLNSKITTLDSKKANATSVYTKTEVNNNFYNKTEIDTMLSESSTSSGGSAVLTQDLVASETIGVITPGKTYTKGTDLETIIRDILIKYTKPSISLAINPSTTLYDAVTGSITSVTLTAVVKKNTKDVVNVKFYIDDSVVQTITVNVKNGGTFTYQYKPTLPIKKSIKFSASTADDQSTVTSNVNVVFIGKSYYGTVGPDISQPTEAQVKALNNTLKNSKAYTYSGITMTYGKVVYAYPASLGNLTKIMDNVNNVNYTDSFARTQITIDGINYNVYTQIDPSAATDVKIDFT